MRTNKGLLKFLLLLLSIASLFTIFVTFSSRSPLQVAFLPKPKEENKTCGCEKCISDYHSWFMQFFQKNITPFLTSNYNLSQEDFDWWRRFQFERRSLAHFRAVQKRLLQYFPGRPVVEADPEQCRRCAVVGNSGNLNRSHYGKLIDFHDVVFRINQGQTKGFEEHVGNKTTHRVMFPNSAMNLDNSTHMIFVPFKIWDMEWLLRGTKGINTTQWFQEVLMKTPVSANKNLVMVVNPAFMTYVHKIWLKKKGQYGSTGFMTVVLALHMCDEVSVFGFGADSNGNWNHYWEFLKNKRLKTGNHPGSVEYDMTMELGKKGKVTFYTGL